MITTARPILIGLCLSLVPSALFAQTNWPSFRNGGSGVLNADNAPLNWSPETNIAWQSDIPGYGQSAPVIWNGCVFLTSCDGQWQEHGYVHSYELQSGRKLWTTEVPATSKVENYFRNSRAAPTCTVDENVVVSFFPGGDVTAMNHNGETLWSVPLFERYGEVDNERATASSLAQSENLVFVLVDHHGPSYLVALRKSDGNIVWKADRGTRSPSWTSPVVVRHSDRELVLASSSGTLDAYDANTGDLLFQVSELEGNHIASPTIADESVFVGAAPPVHGSFDAGKVAASNCRITLTERDAQSRYRIEWAAKRAYANYATPLAIAGYVYYVNKSGILHCLNAETGQEMFRERLGGPCWTSPIGVTTSSGQTLVYFVMKNGETLILKPADEFEPIARNQLWDEDQMLEAAEAARIQRDANKVPADEAPPKPGPETVFAELPEAQLHAMFSYGDPTVYAAAMVDGHLLIRTGQRLYCIRE